MNCNIYNELLDKLKDKSPVPSTFFIGDQFVILRMLEIQRCLLSHLEMGTSELPVRNTAASDSLYLAPTDPTEILEMINATKPKKSKKKCKTKHVLFSRTKRGNSVPDKYDLKLGVDTLQRKAVVKFLGIFLDENIKWSQHIDYIQAQISRSAYLMRTMRKHVFASDMKTLYYTMVYPYLNFGIES